MRFAAAMLVLAMPGALAAAAPIAGHWTVPDGTAVVAIGPCGATTCGRIERVMKRPADAAMRGHPLLGLTILSAMTDTGKDWRGTILDPKSGRSYRSILSREGDGSLKVQGCVAFFCQTQRWVAAR